ncbi:MAG: FAD-dependent oxidoreductase, partial [Desulfobulbaceae bacterium]|nr:FAD-dependent oxidoreductase [Desulfobulbaceae bacterium]
SFREALDLDKFPRSVAIVGGGPIGMEFASIWRRYGADVHIVEMMPRILPLEDEDVAQEAEHQFIRAGMKIRTGARVETIRTSEKGVVVRFTGEKGPEEIHVEKVLVAAGFVPNIDRLGLETTDVKSLDGRIVVNAQMRTSVEHIYAIGDVNGLMGLAHVASAQGIIASETIAGRKTEPLDYVNIPRCTYTDPEIASVGLTEKQAKEKGGHVLAVQSPLAPNGKAVAMNQNVGFVKIIAEADTGKILGAHMVGAHVTDLIAGPACMISMGATVGQMARVIYPHPTLGEAIMEALHALDGCAIHI